MAGVQVSAAKEGRDVERRSLSLIRTGDFALRAFQAGEPVLDFGGPVVSGAALKDGMRALQVGPDNWIVESPQ